MAKQFTGFQQMMMITLDKLNDLEAWWTIVETSMGSMIQQSKGDDDEGLAVGGASNTTTASSAASSAPPMMHPPPPLPMMPNPLAVPTPPPGWFDLTPS